MYNDYNKTVLRDLKLPWTVSALQLGLGLMFWVAPLWLTGMRKMPKISVDNVRPESAQRVERTVDVPCSSADYRVGSRVE